MWNDITMHGYSPIVHSKQAYGRDEIDFVTSFPNCECTKCAALWWRLTLVDVSGPFQPAELSRREPRRDLICMRDWCQIDLAK